MENLLSPGTWRPDDLKTLKEAYAIALQTLKRQGRNRKEDREAMAKEIISLAMQGCLDARKLAFRSLVRTLG